MFKKSNLLYRDEKQLHEGRLHYIVILKSLVTLGVVIALIMFLPNILGGYESNWEKLDHLDFANRSYQFFSRNLVYSLDNLFLMTSQISLALFGAFSFIKALIAYFSNFVLITDHRLIYKKGLIFVNIREVEIEEIKETNLNFGFLGRFLKYACIHVDTRFVEDLNLPCMSKPYKFMKILHATHDPYIHTYNEMIKKDERK